MESSVYFRQRAVSLFFLLFFSLPGILFSQTTEDCNNGLDDDLDGLIDCYDQDCTCSGQCDSFYYTTCNADCYYVPPCDDITLGIQWTAQAETGTYSPLVAGDMDKDGIPDIVTYRVEGPDIYIIDGATGATKIHIVGPTDYPGGTAPAIADLDHDGFGELVLVGNDRILRCWNHDGTLAFASTVQVGYNLGYRFSVPNIADFDHNGWAEVNIGNQVFNGQTGALLAQGGAGVSAGEHPARVLNGFSFCSPVAMDVLPDNFCTDCAGLEIVAGNQVLSVNLVTGAVTPIVTAPAPFTDGFTSVVDFDRDGDLDAIVQGRRGGQNFVYCWDIQTPTIMRQFQLQNNWQEGASRVNVADLDGDGQLEISFVSYPTLYALKNNFTILWTIATNDASAITCSSVFDFCGDGSSDVVYRGQTFLQVLEGATGQIKWQDDCVSETHIENPLILDVDADGQTEIVIQCATGPGGNGPFPGTVVCYEALGLPGISSRQVWNQHAYFNTNINDDLSVPRYQQNPSIIGDSLRMNAFLNQFFNPTFPTPDGALTIQEVVCAGDSLVLSATLCNLGDNVLPPQTPVSAYLGNPQTAAAQWVGTLPLGFSLPKDSCRSFVLRLPRVANDSVFIVLNDNHAKPAPFSLATDFPVTTIGECDFENNIASFYYAYDPDVLDIGSDTAICANSTLGLNADGNDFVGWLWTGGSNLPTIIALGAGSYTVTVTDVCGLTQSDQIIISTDSSTVVNIGADRAICQGEIVTLQESGFDFYNWSPAAAVSCANCDTVTVQPATSGLVILQAGFDNGCMDRDSVYLTVYDTFNYRIDTTICYGRTVIWNGVTIAPDSSQTFFLQTVHGCDSTLQVRVNGSAVGTYQIQVDTAVCLGTSLSYNGFTLAAGDEKTFNLAAFTGCDSTVMVKVFAKDTFATAEARTICAGDTSLIFGQNEIATGTYRSTFLARNGCDSTHTVQLTVLDPLSISLEVTPTCFNESTGTVTALVIGQVPPFSYQWNTFSTNAATLDHLPAADYALTVTDANDCTQTATAQVPAYPAIVFEADPDSVRCYGEANGSIQVNAADSTLLFSLNGGDFSQQRKYTGLGAADYTLYAQDVYGCVDTLATAVQAPPEFQVSLPADTSLVLGESIPLQTDVFGFDPVRYTWSDTSYLSCTNCPSPVATPLTSIRYLLTVTDRNGCTASDAVTLRVQRLVQVYVPNAITPSRGQNSRLEINFGPAIQIVRSFRVFDRWGTLLHEVLDSTPDDTASAWNGTHRGKNVLPGVYLWQLEVALVDGTVELYQGDVTVLR